MLNTDYLQTFVSVVELGSYSAAAERLHLTQPAVSRQIHLLEKQLGDIRLFRRSGQRMILTHAGEELLPAARELLALAERTEEAMLALRGHITGRVVVACSPATGSLVLPALLAEFRHRFPAVLSVVEVGPPDQIADWLQEGRAHLLFFEEGGRRKGWEGILLGSEPLVCMAQREHAWAAEELLTTGMLREQPLILPRQGTPLRRTIEEGLRRRGLQPAELQVVLETDSVESALEAVRSGSGLAFAPISYARRHSDLIALNFSGLRISQDWFLVRSRERHQRRASYECAAFLQSEEATAILASYGIQRPTKE
ncbi:MAG: LysR family transcriptional regulator [Herpetosiphonaceae bacterium]|nr:MAG: LysR family transcriptional regulator [Herpetosiphonaceae bacterium]